MKKNSLIMALLLAAFCLGACHFKTKTDNKKLNIVATIYPEYDWVLQILGEEKANAEVTLLLDNGVDLHSYQPTAEDILKISECDLFIYVGGESDEWVEDVMASANNKDLVTIDLLETLGDKAKEEELIEGMQGEEEDEGEEGPEYDEHVWLSLKNAGIFVDEISEKLQSLDAEHAETYKKNAEAYKEKLLDLDKRFEEVVSASSTKTLLFGDRFPFRYLIEDYGLSYYAAFIGCSAETEASFETIAFLSQKTDELALSSVITIEGSDQKIAKTIIENTSTKDQKILVMDSMQSVTSKDLKTDISYLSIMEKNLETLEEALK